MAATSFYLDEADEKPIVSTILQQGAWFIPNHRDYREPEPHKVLTLDEFVEVRSRVDAFFIANENWFRSPLEFREIGPTNGRPRYYIMPRNGGPVLLYDCPLSDFVTKESGLGSGSVSYYPSYWNTILSANEKVPKEVVDFYMLILKQIRNSCFKYASESSRRTYYIGRAALKRFINGAELIGTNRMNLMGQVRLRSPNLFEASE